MRFNKYLKNKFKKPSCCKIVYLELSFKSFEKCMKPTEYIKMYLFSVVQTIAVQTACIYSTAEKSLFIR